LRNRKGVSLCKEEYQDEGESDAAMGIRCGRYGDYPGHQITAAGVRCPPLDEAREDLLRGHVKSAIPEAISDNVHQLEMSRWNKTRGSPEGEFQKLLCSDSKAIIPYAAIRRPIFTNEYFRSTSIDGFRKPGSIVPVVSLFPVALFPMMQPDDQCRDRMSSNCEAGGPCEAVNLIGVTG
jgi:hypothetical protein